MTALPISVAPKNVPKGIRKCPHVIPARSNNGLGICNKACNARNQLATKTIRYFPETTKSLFVAQQWTYTGSLTVSITGSYYQQHLYHLWPIPSSQHHQIRS